MKVEYLEGKMVQNRPGKVRLIPEEPEDIWLAYNLIDQGDFVTAVTTVKSQPALQSFDGKDARIRPKSCPVRVKVEVELKIIETNYAKDSSSLRVRGRIINSSEEGSIGLFHSTELEINKAFDLGKSRWDKSEVEKLREAGERPVGPDLAVIVFQQRTAQLHLLGNRVTSLCWNIEDSNSVKARGNKFFEGVFCAFMKFVSFDSVKWVIIGSPDSVKDEFRRYLISESQKKKLAVVQNNRSRILTAGIKEGKKINIHDLFDDKSVTNKIRDSKTGQQILTYKLFVDLLERNSDLVCYGIEDVEDAVENGAIESLLVTDDLVRFSDRATSTKYAALVETVKKTGGQVCEYSVRHGYGEGLAKVTGVAAILRFPLHFSS